jgi:hypothetical protein
MYKLIWNQLDPSFKWLGCYKLYIWKHIYKRRCNFKIFKKTYVDEKFLYTYVLYFNFAFNTNNLSEMVQKTLKSTKPDQISTASFIFLWVTHNVFSIYEQFSLTLLFECVTLFHIAAGKSTKKLKTSQPGEHM